MKGTWIIGVGMGLLWGTASAVAEVGRANLWGKEDTKSTVGGTATIREVAEGMGIQADINVWGIPPAGQHGIHIHQYGDCADGGNAAGGHYNPNNAPHGFLPKDGMAGAHPGDMGNIEVGTDGKGHLSITLPGVTLSQVAGRAIVLHEKPDDFGQPTGNAGGRIGCGLILITKD